MLLFRHLSAALAVLLIPALLASCGFRPLHGGRPGGETVADLAGIDVKPIADRSGQRLRNRLQDILTPGGRPDKPQYFLSIKLNESIQHFAVEKNAFASRANLVMTANFTFLEAGTGATLFRGTSSIVSSYDILTSDFGTLMAEKNARTSAIEMIGDDIRTRLSVFLSRPDTNKGAEKS